MNWIGKTLRSFNVSGSSAIRFLGDGTKNPEAKRFHEMVRDLDKKNSISSIDPCIDYFNEHFGSYEISELDNLRLNKEATYLTLQYLPFFAEILNNYSNPTTKKAIDHGFLFLEKAIFIFTPEPKNIQPLAQIIYKILETNNEIILSRSMVFVSKCLSIQILANLFYYQGDALTNLWDTCFVNNQVSCQFYGPLFTATAEEIQFNVKNPDAYKQFFNQVIESFRQIKFSLKKPGTPKSPKDETSEDTLDSNVENIQNAFNFVAVICSKLNSGNFFDDFFLVAKIYFFNLPSLNVFSTFFICKTSNPKSPWESINEICKSEFSSPELIESAIEVVHGFLESPLILNFSFNAIIKRAKEISFQSQELLFDIIDHFPLSSKLDFFNFSIPTWDTGINSQLLCDNLVKKNIWGQYSNVMLSTLALKAEYNVFRDNLVKDKYISEIVTVLIDMVSNEEEISTILYNEFIKLAKEGIEVGNHVIEKIAHNDNVIIYLEQFLIALRENLVCDSVFDIYTKFSRKNLFFVLSFLENDGIQFLFPHLISDSSLDFLAALASNGPYDSIDNYIVDHFKGSELSKHPSNKLLNLLMGMPQNSTSQGLLRIPSLLKFLKTEEISLSTQHDRFIFGTNANKYGVDNRENLLKYSPTYMSPRNAKIICTDPEMLLHITSPNYPHFSVFQCHKEAPHCTATLKLEVTTTFWIYVISLFDKTVIMSTPFGDISIEKDDEDNTIDPSKTNVIINGNFPQSNSVKISFFGLPSLQFELKTWHMITLTATEWTFQQQQIVVYFNTTKIGEINGAVGSTVTLGSEDMNNSIYYLSSSFQTFDSAVTISDVKQMYQNGPQVFCPTLIKMKPGFQFIPYKGIAKYLKRLGGKEFIFIQMRKTNNYTDLIKLIQASFNMLNLGLIKEDFYFYSLRYIIYLKMDMIASNSKSNTENKSKSWHPDFELILYEILDFDIQKKWKYSLKIFTDYNILSTNNDLFHFSILPETFQHSNEYSPESSSKLFHYLVDSYIVFNLTDETEQNVLKSINAYAKTNPNALSLLLLSISAAAFIESNEGSMFSLVDDKAMKKQESLFQIVIDHMDLFVQVTKFEHTLIYISTMRDKLAIDLLQMVAKIAIISPTYFDIEVFKRYYPFLTILSKYQKFWQTLMIFYTGQSADLIEDFADIPISRPEMTDLILDLLSHFIRYELSTKVENPYSFHVVKVVVKLLIASDVAFGDYIAQIQHLSSLGFDQETPTPMPFSIDPNSDLQSSNQSQQNQNENNVVPPKIIKSLTPAKCLFKANEFNTLTRIQALDPSLYEETCLYLSKYNNSLSSMLNNLLNSLSNQDECKNVWKTLGYERYQAPDNIEEYCKSEAVQIIANLVAMVFIQKANASGISNKLLVKLLINGCDVNPSVAQIMHRKIVYAILASNKPLTDENYELFIKFVANRVLEGWWWNDDLFLLFQASFIRRTKSSKQLIFACIYQSNNAESQIRIMKELCTCAEFLEYLTDPYLFCCYIQLIARYEIVSNSLYPDLKRELTEILMTYLKSKRALISSETNNENTSNNETNSETSNDDKNKNNESSSSSATNQILPSSLNTVNSEAINTLNNDPLALLLQALIKPENDYILGWFEKYRSEEPNQALFVKYYNDMKKEAISNSKTIRDLRYDITVPPTYFTILKYQATRIGSALYIRRSFRYQFFSRFNSSNLELESAISSIFQKEMRLKFNENPAEKMMIVPAPQPFVVPQKFDPLCYDFPIPQAKFSSLKNKENNTDSNSNNSNSQTASARKDHCINGAFFPHSIHNRKFSTILPELSEISQNAPKCYEGWKLPVFVMNSIPLDCQFSSFIGATSSLFDCSILMNPELLPGVAGFNNETFSIVLNAQLRNYTFLDNSKTTYEDNGFGFSLYESNIPDLPINFLQILNSSNSSTSIQMVTSIINNYVFHGNLFLRNTSEMLSHFAIIENAAHGIYGPSKLFMHHPVISFRFRDVLIAIPRRFVYQNQEVDIYFVNGLHLTLIMKESDRKQLLLHIRQHQQQSTHSQIHFKSIATSSNFLSPFGPYYAISLLAKSIEKVSKMWQMSEISTYDYLLYLNTAGGRSFNDLSQYPVFPWILGDFDKDKPVLKRDLLKPMGTQTVVRESRFISTYNETEPHCHYRTHYSQPAAVLHYMMRVEPFTFFNLHLHSGLDHRDRQFSSINDAWRSASEANLSDLKELIPEFYTMPMFFENPNHYDFQCRSDGTSLGTVVLPQWTNNDPFKFIWQMRISLECPETSAKIGNWIDLIFGYKQRGQAAIDSINVFQPLAYDNAITTIMNENNSKSGGISGGTGNDPNSANADITMNYALNANNNATNNFIDNSTNDISGIDSFSSLSIDMNNVKDYLSSIEQRKALTDAILQFGQCPSQLFTTPHPECDRNPDLQATVTNTPSIYTKLSTFAQNCTTIQFNREKDILTPFALPKFEHYVGNGSSTLVRVWDGYIEFGSASPIRIDSVDSCSSTCVSSDRLILAIASRNGIIEVYSCTNSKVDSSSINKLPLQKINTLICPSFNIKMMAVTTQHAMLCAISHKHIFLFDYTTGFLIKQIVIGSNFDVKKERKENEEEDAGETFENQYENIISVIFDDISNFIVTISSYYITIYGLDLRFISRSEHSKDSGIPQFTSIAISDFPFWSKMPLYITGHKDGSVYAWMADLIEEGIFPLQLIDKSVTNRSPITAVSLFMQNKAILAIDDHGASFLATVDPFKASLHTTQIQQQKEQVLKEQSSLSNSQTSLFSTLLPDVPSLPVSSMPLKHLMMNNDDEPVTEITSNSSFGTSKIASTSIPTSYFSPFNSPTYSQPWLLNSNVFDTCRLCGASIKGGIGSRCVLCCLVVCKQCIASKRPMICSYCKSQFASANDSKETSDEPAPSVSSVPSIEIDLSPTDRNKSLKSPRKTGMFANAFSFKKENKKPKLEPSKENANTIENSNKKQENESSSQETEKTTNNENSSNDNKSNVQNEDQQEAIFPKLYNNNDNNNELDEFDSSLFNINQIRRYSLVQPQIHFGGQMSPPSKKSVVNFDFGINSTSNDSSTEAVHDTILNENSEPIPNVPLKEHHSQKLTHTQIQMNMSMDQDEESSQRQAQDRIQRTRSFITPQNKKFRPQDKNDDFGTVILRYREEPRANNNNNNHRGIRRRYSFSHHPHSFS